MRSERNLCLSIGGENVLIIFKNSDSSNIGKYAKVKNCPFSKAYRHVCCIHTFVSAFFNLNST